MYNHQVTLTRPNTSAPFFYSSLLTNQDYLSFKQKYIDSGMLLKETIEESQDGLQMTRTLQLRDKAAFEALIAEWSEKNSFYVKNFQEYSVTNNHTVTFEAFEA